MRDIAAVTVDDGIVFDPASVAVEEIRKEAGYGGVRVIIAGDLARARCKTQIDVGFGDAVTSAPVDSVYPVLLEDMPAPQLRAYPTYTVPFPNNNREEVFHEQVDFGDWPLRARHARLCHEELRAPRKTMNCREIQLEQAKVQGCVQAVDKESEFSGRSVLPFLGDFGIGNVIEKNAAMESADSRAYQLRMLSFERGCSEKNQAAKPSRSNQRAVELTEFADKRVTWKQKRTRGYNAKRCNPLNMLVAWDGIEPPTQGFSILCSTD